MTYTTTAFNEIETRFTTHPLTAVQKARIASVKAMILSLAHVLDSELPAGREKAQAISCLEQVSFYSAAGVARPQLGLTA